MKGTVEPASSRATAAATWCGLTASSAAIRDSIDSIGGFRGISDHGARTMLKGTRRHKACQMRASLPCRGRARTYSGGARGPFGHVPQSGCNESIDGGVPTSNTRVLGHHALEAY